MMKTSQQKGFTLIELIMVIVILGVLSAFALPRFANFGSDAEKASVEGARASVQSAAGIVRSAALVQKMGQSTGSVDVEDTSVSVADGYLAASGVSIAAQLNDFHVETSTAPSTDIYITVDGNPAGSPCFTFSEGTPPSISQVANNIVSGTWCVPGSDS